jgi:magnesium transporter
MDMQAHNLASRPGAAPGIEHHELAELPSSAGVTTITCIDYCPARFEVQQVDNVAEFVAGHRPEWSVVRWIDLTGLSDMPAIHALATKYDLHPLTIEDVLHKTQRPKVESYGGEESEFQARLFIVARSLRLDEARLRHAQVSIFLGHHTLLTFQDQHSDRWDAIRQRIEAKGSRLRESDASFLAYSLLDALVDQCFPILEAFSTRAEILEEAILANTQTGIINQIHQLKRDLLLMHWVIWPLREVVSNLQREAYECISDSTRVYLRDLYDHVIQIIDIIETYREITSDLTETYMSSVSNRMNETMKTLTIIGTIFIPLTFLAGVYGMNFRHLPELNQRWAYPAFWAVCLVTAVGMLLYFRRRKWF